MLLHFVQAMLIGNSFSHLMPTVLLAEGANETIMESNGLVHDCRVPAHHSATVQADERCLSQTLGCGSHCLATVHCTRGSMLACDTMRFKITTKLLTQRMLMYYRIHCVRASSIGWRTSAAMHANLASGLVLPFPQDGGASYICHA